MVLAKGFARRLCTSAPPSYASSDFHATSWRAGETRHGSAEDGPAASSSSTTCHGLPPRPASSTWGWHWTMNHFDPDKKQDGKRSIASHYYPLIGPYDSGDPAVIEYHRLLMKLAGIDGVIVDWYGLSNLYDYPQVHRNSAWLFHSTTKLGLRFGVCYEDQTVARLVEAKKLPAGDRVQHVRQEIDWSARTGSPTRPT